jgi:Tfp pilus assembly protein PilZ
MDALSTIFSRDRRFAERFNVKTTLHLRVWKSGLPEQKAESVNLSRRGIFFSTNSNLSKGQVVEILLKMPEEITGEPPTEWRCTGYVVRVESANSSNERFGVGVHFYCYESSRVEQPQLPRAAALPQHESVVQGHARNRAS